MKKGKNMAAEGAEKRIRRERWWKGQRQGSRYTRAYVDAHKLRCNYKPGDYDRISGKRRRSYGRTGVGSQRVRKSPVPGPSVDEKERKKRRKRTIRGNDAKGCSWKRDRSKLVEHPSLFSFIGQLLVAREKKMVGKTRSVERKCEMRGNGWRTYESWWMQSGTFAYRDTVRVRG